MNHEQQMQSLGLGAPMAPAGLGDTTTPPQTSTQSSPAKQVFMGGVVGALLGGFTAAGIATKGSFNLMDISSANGEIAGLGMGTAAALGALVGSTIAASRLPSGSAT